MDEVKIKLTTDASLLDVAEIQKTAKSLYDFTQHLNVVSDSKNYDADEASINLPADEEMITAIKQVMEKFATEDLKYIVVIGIGGSNLGTMAVYDAIYGMLDKYTGRTPKILFADTVSPKTVQGIIDILNTTTKASEMILNVISKSGGTTETIANFETIYTATKAKFDDIDSRIIVTTSKDSALWQQAAVKKWSTVSLPDKVGGRYSVFSTVGIIPLALANVHVGELLDGALDMRNVCLQADIQKNPAMLGAVIMFLHYKKGITISNHFMFNPELESVGKWYRQLMGESIGKQHDLDGADVRAGITPIVSIGSTDLHSMAQLYFGGPKDKLTTIVYHSESESTVVVPTERVMPGLVEGIAGKKQSELMDAIIGGTEAAYKSNGLPVLKINMPKIDEETVGEFLQMKMMEMMYLAKLMNVNAFDQPNVEDYKKETKKLLEA